MREQIKNSIFSQNYKPDDIKAAFFDQISEDTEYVITEYGIADLWGKTNADKARALINIAHPDFRAELKEDFEKMFHQKF